MRPENKSQIQAERNNIQIDPRNPYKVVSFLSNQSGHIQKCQTQKNLQQSQNQGNNLQIKKKLSQDNFDMKYYQGKLKLDIGQQTEQDDFVQDDDFIIQNDGYFMQRILHPKEREVSQNTQNSESNVNKNSILSSNPKKMNDSKQHQILSQIIQNYPVNRALGQKQRNPSNSNLFENEIINSRISESRSNTFMNSTVFKNFQDCDFGVISVEIPTKKRYKDFHTIERQIYFNNKILSDKSNSFHMKTGQEIQSPLINKSNDTSKNQQQLGFQGFNQKDSVVDKKNLNPQNSPSKLNGNLEEKNLFCNLSQEIFKENENSQTPILDQPQEQIGRVRVSQSEKDIQNIIFCQQGQKKNNQGVQNHQKPADNIDMPLQVKKDQSTETIKKQSENSVKQQISSQKISTPKKLQFQYQNMVQSIKPQSQKVQPIQKQLNQFFQLQQQHQQQNQLKQNGVQANIKQIQNYQQQQQALQFYHQQHNQNSLKRNSSSLHQKSDSNSNSNQFMKQYETMITQLYGKKDQKLDIEITEEKQIYDIRVQVQREVIKPHQKQLQNATDQNEKKLSIQQQNLVETNQDKIINSNHSIQNQGIASESRNFRDAEKAVSLESQNLRKNNPALMNEDKTKGIYQIIHKSPSSNLIVSKKNFPEQIMQESELQKFINLQSSSTKNSQNNNIKTIFSVTKSNSFKTEKKTINQSKDFLFQTKFSLHENNDQNNQFQQKPEEDNMNLHLIQKKEEKQSNQTEWWYKNSFKSQSITLQPKVEQPTNNNNLHNKQNQCCQTNLESIFSNESGNMPQKGNLISLTDRSNNLKQISISQSNESASKLLYPSDHNANNNVNMMKGSSFTVLDIKSKKDIKPQLKEDSNLLNQLESRFNRKQSFLQANLKLVTSQNSNNPINGFYQIKMKNANNQNNKLLQLQMNTSSNIHSNNFYKPFAASPIVKSSQNINNKPYTNVSQESFSSSITKLNTNTKSFQTIQTIDKDKQGYKYSNKFSQIFKNSSNQNIEEQLTQNQTTNQSIFEITHRPTKIQRKDQQLNIISQQQQNS